MKGTKLAVQGWSIVGWSALAIGIMVSVIWLVHGINEQGMRIAIRATARTSCILFLIAFVASALRRIWSTPLTAWLLKNRRYLGLSFAVSHTYHALLKTSANLRIYALKADRTCSAGAFANMRGH